MRKVITFLGRQKKETTYQFEGVAYTGRVFAEALRQFVDYDRMLVFVTPEAKTDAWPVLAALGDSRIQAVDIPCGETTEEMWGIFSAVTECVDEEETVVFDITHGLRSLPFLVFLFAAYLKSAKRVTIEAIYYGAFELGKDRPAPVVDLSDFVTMLDWLTATDQFTQTGNAGRLADLIRMQGDSEGATVLASHALSRISRAAFLCQPFTLIEQVDDLDRALESTRMALHTSARPFDVVHSEVSKTFGQFRADRADPRAMLRAQYRLIEWYYGNNQLMLAVTLAREWLVSAVTYRLERPIDLGREARQEMEHAITGLERIGSRPGFTVACLNEYGRRIHDEWPDWRELRGLCSALASVRNTLDHAEHQKDAMKLEKIVKKIDTVIIPKLRGLAEAWGII